MPTTGCATDVLSTEGEKTFRSLMDDIICAYNQSFPIHQAQKLQYLSLHSSIYGPLVTIDDKLPSTLVEISLDQPMFRPAFAIRFFQQRKGGPLKRLSVRLDEGSAIFDWGKAGLRGAEMGIKFRSTIVEFKLCHSMYQI